MATGTPLSTKSVGSYAGVGALPSTHGHMGMLPGAASTGQTLMLGSSAMSGGDVDRSLDVLHRQRGVLHDLLQLQDEWRAQRVEMETHFKSEREE